MVVHHPFSAHTHSLMLECKCAFMRKSAILLFDLMKPDWPDGFGVFHFLLTIKMSRDLELSRSILTSVSL